MIYKTLHLEKFHPIVLHLAKTIPQYLALMDRSISANLIQSTANAAAKGYSLPQLFFNNANILLKEKAKSFTDIIEAAQISVFFPLTQKQVVAGDTHVMRYTYKKLQFPSMQQNQDVSLMFKGSQYDFQGDIGVDQKYIMGKTEYSHGNQISVGTITVYEKSLALFTEKLLRQHNIPNIEPVLKKLLPLAKENNWTAHVEIVGHNAINTPNNANTGHQN